MEARFALRKAYIRNESAEWAGGGMKMEGGILLCYAGASIA